MFKKTIAKINCPQKHSKPCLGNLSLLKNTLEKNHDIIEGTLQCVKCQTQYPIINGVALLVSDVASYLIEHVKGFSQVVNDSSIPSTYRQPYKAAKANIATHHIEDDLEAERVNALYLLTHYFKAERNWWRPDSQYDYSPFIDQTIKQYWNEGPFSKINLLLKQAQLAKQNCLELGCNVGGLAVALNPFLKSYLGVDSSFVSIALARHIYFASPYKPTTKIAADLLNGAVSRPIDLKNLVARSNFNDDFDFIVADLNQLPLANHSFDLCIALNTIDMLEKPESLISQQQKYLTKAGWAIQSCPYIWHPMVAAKLKKKIPAHLTDSALAVEWLYQQAGFKIINKYNHVPWIFFKHFRQIEMYSIHLFLAQCP